MLTITNLHVKPDCEDCMIVNSFVCGVLTQLPMEFAVEVQKLIGISLERTVG
jgi:Fe-S cluster assembly scaffold protein SufB